MKRKKENKSRTVRLLQAGGAGMAAATRGRARTFTDRKKEASRKACRKKIR